MLYVLFLGICVLFVNPKKEYEKNSAFYRFLLDSATAAALKLLRIRVHVTGMEKEDYLVIVGGDGTLNRFVNDTSGIEHQQEILYFPTGTGNDFAKDLGKDEFSAPFQVTQYLKNLPSVEVKGKTYRFINGVGFGIDGYCCQVGDELKKTPGKKVNYTTV